MCEDGCGRANYARSSDEHPCQRGEVGVDDIIVMLPAWPSSIMASTSCFAWARISPLPPRPRFSPAVENEEGRSWGKPSRAIPLLAAYLSAFFWQPGCCLLSSDNGETPYEDLESFSSERTQPTSVRSATVGEGRDVGVDESRGVAVGERESVLGAARMSRPATVAEGRWPLSAYDASPRSDGQLMSIYG